METLAGLYPVVFYGTVMCLAVAELIVPRRLQGAPVSRRWTTNIGLFAVGVVIQGVLVPVSAVTLAEWARQSGAGIFHRIDLTGVAAILLGVLVLDLWKYIEHRLSHGVSLLWRLHLVHHSDVDADFTTAERHHPLEVILGIGTFFAVIYLLGIPPLAVIVYMLLGAAIALFSHANIGIPEPVERRLRWIVVTPGVHTVHHSAARRETDSNFGLLLTVWDRIFGTYRTSTPAQDAARVIGLEYFRDPRSGRLDRVLWLPFLPRAAHRQSVLAE